MVLTVLSAVGGPDAYGYVWDDGVAFEWHTATNVVGSGDDAYFSVPLPFPVTFYGNTYNTVYVSTNGWASFEPVTSSYLSNSNLPNTSNPNALLAVFWDDLVVQDNIYTEVVGTSPNRKFVIEWRNVRRYSGSGNASFQIIIYEQQVYGENIIRFSYGNNTMSGSISATVGIENPGGTIGLTYTGANVTGTSPNISGFNANWTVEWRKEGGVACSGTGGPDPFGYVWECRNSVVWSSPSNLIPGSQGANDALFTLSLPFAFEFYGSSYTSITVSTNGWIGLGTGFSSSFPVNTNIPSASPPNNIIAVYWDDLELSPTGGIYYESGGTAPNRWFKVEWSGVRHVGTSTYEGRFGVILYEGGYGGGDSILFYYDVARIGGGPYDFAGDATIGIESPVGGVGLLYSYNTTSITNGTGIAWLKYPPEDFSERDEFWKQYRHDFRRTGRTPLRATCPSSMAELYDVVHGGLDIGIITANVNRDGDHDILANETTSDGIKAFDGNSGAALWLNPGDNYPTPIASIAASNISQKVYSNAEQYFEVIDLATGATVYSYDKVDGRGPSPLVADVDSDGCPEVFVAYGGTAVSVSGCASTYIENWTYSAATLHAAALGDVDGDGNYEVLYPAYDGNVYVLDALTGAFHSSFAAGVPSGVSTPPDYTVAVGDLDGDGDHEVVVPGVGSVSAYDYGMSGWSQMWSVSAPSNSVVALGDKDGDGLEDVWYVSSGELHVVKGTDGSPLGRTSGAGAFSNYPPTLMDLTGDGSLDAIIVESSGNAIRLIDGSTMGVISTLGTTPYNVTSEIVVLKISPTDVAFAVGDHSCYVTVWGPCILGGLDEELAVEEERREISFKVEGSVLHVSTTHPTPIRVYDVAGRLKYAKSLSVGRHTIYLDVPRGVYMVRLGDRLYRVLLR